VRVCARACERDMMGAREVKRAGERCALACQALWCTHSHACTHVSLPEPSTTHRFIVHASLGRVGFILVPQRDSPIVCCVELSHVSQPIVHPWLNHRQLCPLMLARVPGLQPSHELPVTLSTWTTVVLPQLQL
jgi:hypothetical protein